MSVQIRNELRCLAVQETLLSVSQACCVGAMLQEHIGLHFLRRRWYCR